MIAHLMLGATACGVAPGQAPRIVRCPPDGPLYEKNLIVWAPIWSPIKQVRQQGSVVICFPRVLTHRDTTGLKPVVVIDAVHQHQNPSIVAFRKASQRINGNVARHPIQRLRLIMDDVKLVLRAGHGIKLPKGVPQSLPIVRQRRADHRSSTFCRSSIARRRKSSARCNAA